MSLLANAVAQVWFFAQLQCLVKKTVRSNHFAAPHGIATTQAVVSGGNMPVQAAHPHINTLLRKCLHALAKRAGNARVGFQRLHCSFQPPHLQHTVSVNQLHIVSTRLRQPHIARFGRRGPLRLQAQHLHTRHSFRNSHTQVFGAAVDIKHLQLTMGGTCIEHSLQCAAQTGFFVKPNYHHRQA